MSQSDAKSILCSALKDNTQSISELLPLMDEQTKQLFTTNDCKYVSIGDIAAMPKIELKTYITKKKTNLKIGNKKWAHERNAIMGALTAFASKK